MLHTIFKDMSTVERLLFVLNHEECFTEMRKRSQFITDALWEAASVLPEGPGKRALNYVARTPQAEFHFGGTDAVGPAIKEAIRILYKTDVEERMIV